MIRKMHHPVTVVDQDAGRGDLLQSLSMCSRLPYRAGGRRTSGGWLSAIMGAAKTKRKRRALHQSRLRIFPSRLPPNRRVYSRHRSDPAEASPVDQWSRPMFTTRLMANAFREPAKKRRPGVALDHIQRPFLPKIDRDKVFCRAAVCSHDVGRGFGTRILF
jgi:hypothetical protein